jgi:hypothetical protein
VVPYLLQQCRVSPEGTWNRVSALNKLNGIEIGPQSRKEYSKLHLSDFQCAQHCDILRLYYLFGSDHDCSFPSNGTTHRSPSSVDPTLRCDPRLRWFVAVRFEAGGCVDLRFAGTIGVSIASAGSATAHWTALPHRLAAKNGLTGMALAQTAGGYL